MKGKIRLAAVLVLGLTLGFAGAVAAEDKPLTPEKLAGAKVVDAAWVKANMDKVKLCDVRKKAEFVEGHIAGAVAVPYDEKSAKAADFNAAEDSFDMSKLPADKSAGIVTYCNGEHCWKSYKAAVWLVKAGYKNVYWFRTGFPEWKAKGFSVE